METAALKKFAQHTRRSLIGQVSTKLAVVLHAESEARKQSPEVLRKLENALQKHGQKQLIEQVAYTWFNRFCALRFMDANRYSRIGIVSPASGQFQPEILAEAKMGHIDEAMVPAERAQQVRDLLSGKTRSSDAQGEAYRLLVTAACNHYSKIMPFMFERISDYSELLMPDDLLSGKSVIAYTREALTPGACENVEAIGWLYQFYIAEKKDDVFAALKKGKKITAENIPAATQLFTPHWIVRYLVENSLGRLWMLNHPDSRLIEQMDYYIKPEEPETDFLRISSPEEIKICDPACGSGHMLTYAFDLLYAIYEEQGYQATDIPRLILTHNLYGIEIDQRAGALAAFALTMKAREKYRRFLTGGKVVQPNICVLENVNIDPEDLSAYMDKVGRDLFSGGLQGVVNQWEEADNFGSLIRPLVTDVSEVLELLRERQMGEDLFLDKTHQKVLKALRQADYLSPKYHAVVANPPYVKWKQMNPAMKDFAESKYEHVKTDLSGIFVDRAISLGGEKSVVSMITMHSWMFLSTLSEFREDLANRRTMLSMAHFGARAFETITGEVVQTTAFVLRSDHESKSKAIYVRLTDLDSEEEKRIALLDAIENSLHERRFVYEQAKLTEIDGCPWAYWISDHTRKIFASSSPFTDYCTPRVGLQTGSNETFVRSWHEVGIDRIGFGIGNCEEAKSSRKRWFPYNKGGEPRRWYGNRELVVDWENDGQRIRSFTDDSGKLRSRPQNRDCYFREAITWADITTSDFAARFSPVGSVFDVKGSSGFPKSDHLHQILGLLNSKLMTGFMEILNPTTTFQVGDMARIPIADFDEKERIGTLVNELITTSKVDWNESETSFDFTSLPILTTKSLSVDKSWSDLSSTWKTIVETMKAREETNNALFISAYGMGNVLSSSVAIEDVSVSCNPAYRYGSDKSESELDAVLLADTMREFISYAVGCMLGRYSLDKPGLILANQGETADDYRQQIPAPTFAPDEDNVIPLLDGDWFTDDISERFKEFLKITFGTEHFEANLTFLENALYPDNLTGKKRKTIRDYFLKDFYNHHIKLYKKRPIYWLFSSPKGSFNALIYMHRYQPDTVSVILNDYLRDYCEKLKNKKNSEEAKSISASASASEKSAALREIKRLTSVLSELEDYEREVLYPLATEQVKIDLDDGVKVNYNKFGPALKKVTGLTGK